MLSEQYFEAEGRQRLVMSLGPAHDLLDADLPRLRDFFIALGAILIDRFPTRQQQTEGEVSIFSKGIVVPAADLAQSAQPDPRDRAAMLRNKSKIHARLLVHLITAGALQVQQTSEQIRSHIQRYDASHHATHLGIEERGNELLDQSAAGNVVGIKNKNDFSLHQFHGVLQRGGFAPFAPSAVKGMDSARMVLAKAVDDFACAVR